jgi:hypothetical protein
MTLKSDDNFYQQQQEPIRSCLLALKTIILSLDKNLNSTLKYGMPFFCYDKKMFCYLWIDKKTQQPYIGIVEGNKIEHPALTKGNRARMKIMLLDANKDLPMLTIKKILKQALSFYK